jgi:hypothetical protein
MQQTNELVAKHTNLDSHQHNQVIISSTYLFEHNTHSELARGMQAEAALNARCTQRRPTGLQSRPKGEQFSSGFLSIHPRTSRPVDPIPPRNMQRGLVASAAVLFRWKECVPECNRFSPFFIDISITSVITRESDTTKSGTGI